jgi:hypothetical protein
MAIQNISALPDAPTPADSPTEFANKAAAFVPSLSGLVTELNQYGIDIVQETSSVVDEAKSEVNITAMGMFNAIVVGDTDGVNNQFTILNASFYPYWMLFIDGVKVPNSGITINGSVATLTSTPTSGAIIEALAPMSTDFIAPDGFKTIAFCSDKNGTIELECTSNGSTPQWKVGSVITESTTFSYANDGEYIYIFLYVPDDSTNSVLDADAQDIYLIECQREISSLDQIKMRDNSNLSYIDSLVNLSGLTSLSSAWNSCGLTSFPAIDSSKCTTFFRAWYANDLISFPYIDSSSCTSFNAAWAYNDLESFPALDSSACTSFSGSWRNNNLTEFPTMDITSVSSFSRAWYGNTNLTTWSANYFNSARTDADYTEAWTNCALTQTSVDNILISINTSGASNASIGLDGGTNATPSATGLAAKSDLESRGCTVNVN